MSTRTDHIARMAVLSILASTPPGQVALRAGKTPVTITSSVTPGSHPDHIADHIPDHTADHTVGESGHTGQARKMRVWRVLGRWVWDCTMCRPAVQGSAATWGKALANAVRHCERTRPQHHAYVCRHFGPYIDTED